MGFIKKIKSSRSVSSKSTSKQKNKKATTKFKSLPVINNNTEQHQELDTVDETTGSNGGGGRLSISCISLGSGSFSASGVFSLTSSTSTLFTNSPNSNDTLSLGSFSDNGDDSSDDSLEGDRIFGSSSVSSKLAPLKEVLASYVPKTFIRTADLPHMQKAAIERRRSSFSELADDELIDHVHKPSSHPPLPSMEHDPKESWVALDDGNGNKSPLAEAAMAALVKTGLDVSMEKSMWTPQGGTGKLIKSGVWDETIFCEWGRSVPAPHAKGSKGEKDVLIWSGTWGHKYYGHDLPAIRSESIVNMSPRALATLLMDSDRVKEYNKMSVGRDDILVLHEDEECITKVSIGRSKPPMLGKTLMLKSLLHMEELPGGCKQGGYVLASRAVAHADDAEAVEDPKVVHSEMLMGINVIRAVEGESDRCVLINLNHLRSPMIPMMLAKRLGLGAAVNFINDIRALC